MTRADTNESGPRRSPVKVKKGDESFDVVVKMDGYKTQTRQVSDRSRRTSVLVPLEKVEAPVQQAVNVAPPTTPAVVPVVEKPATRQHRSSLDASSTKADKERRHQDRRERDDEAAPSPRSKKDESDDMKLLQPKF